MSKHLQSIRSQYLVQKKFMKFFQEILSVEKNVCVREEEVLLVNGTPITLEGDEGRAIKVRSYYLLPSRYLNRSQRGPQGWAKKIG